MSSLKILIIIQRSNGDVLLAASLINEIYNHFQTDGIDLLINDDTLPVAKSLSNINKIHTFSYTKKNTNRWRQEREIINLIFRKYDLSINLTSSDRSVLYALLASKKSISAIERKTSKSWWKKKLLSSSYYFDSNKHILLNNLEPLSLLGIKSSIKLSPLARDENAEQSIQYKLQTLNIDNFLIFHPSAQYQYKMYPEKLRTELFHLLNGLGVSIIVTGGSNNLDSQVREEIPHLDNIINWIGNTSMNEYIALSKLSMAYIGMDTLNMHLAATQNKRIFAIFGPTKLDMWSPWSNELKISASVNMPMQTYGKVTIFQANMPCVACGNAGCDNRHGKSECLDHIDPHMIFNEVERWYKNV